MAVLPVATSAALTCKLTVVAAENPVSLTSYSYRSDTVELYNPNQGGPNDKAEVVTDDENPNWPTLSYNPGRIEPDAEAWSNSRKPLIAQWKPLKGTGKTFFTVNVHFGSKGGSSSLHGDPRPPINKGVEKRETQAEITAVSTCLE